MKLMLRTAGMEGQREAVCVWHVGEWETARALTAPWGTSNLSKHIWGTVCYFFHTHACCGNGRNI